MKLIRIFLILFILSQNIVAQTPARVQSKQGVFTDGIYIRDRWIDGISTTLNNSDSLANGKLPTNKAVTDWVRSFTKRGDSLTFTRWANGISASSFVPNYPATRLDSIKYKFSMVPYGAGGEYGGWLAPNIAGDSIKVSTAFGVIISNSIGEGHPSTHGRLHPTIDLTKPDVPGQLSYHLRTLTRFRWFNHGIGGQTSTQVWARWNRDILAQTVDGVTTLTGKPAFVIIEVGINDFYNGISVATLKQNLTRMAASLAREGIYCVILTVPGDEWNNATQNRQVEEINTWLRSGALNPFSVVLVDFNKWWRDSAYDDNMHGNSLLIDDIHLTPAGYDSLSNFIFREARLPRLEGIIFHNDISPAGFTGYSRPTDITFNNIPLTIDAAVDTVLITAPLTIDTAWVKINSSTNITGTSYTGFNHIEYLFSFPKGNNILTKGVGSADQTLYPYLTTVNGNIGVHTLTPSTPFEVNSSISRTEFVPVGPELRTYLNLAGGQGPNSHASKGGFYIILPDGGDCTFANLELDVTDGIYGASKILIGLGNHVGNVSYSGAFASLQPSIRIGGGPGCTNMYIVVGDSTITWDYAVLKINRISLYAGFSATRFQSYDTVKVRFTTTPLTLFNSVATTFTYPLTHHTPVITGGKGTAALDFPSTVAGTSSELTIVMTGAADGDIIALGVQNVCESANSCFTARVSAPNTVTVKLNNYSAAPIDPPLGNFKFTLIKF